MRLLGKKRLLLTLILLNKPDRRENTFLIVNPELVEGQTKKIVANSRAGVAKNY